jgi:Ca2+-binding EF-hand superfamily protein
MSLITSSSQSDDSGRDELLDLQQVFAAFDKQAEGPPNRLTADKLTQILKTQLEISPTPEQVRDIIAAVDLNDSGDVQFNEFLKLMEKKPNQTLLERKLENEEELEILQFSTEQFRDIFRSFDSDSDGLISVDDLRSALEKYNLFPAGQKWGEEELNAIVQLVDPNSKTGMIGYQAFVRLMMTQVE